MLVSSLRCTKHTRLTCPHRRIRFTGARSTNRLEIARLSTAGPKLTPRHGKYGRRSDVTERRSSRSGSGIEVVPLSFRVGSNRKHIRVLPRRERGETRHCSCSHCRSRTARFGEHFVVNEHAETDVSRLHEYARVYFHRHRRSCRIIRITTR